MPKTHILVIEDDDDARMMYGIMLRSWGYEVAEATTGREGIKAALRQAPDVILLDIMMPDMDGYEVCQQLRSDMGFNRVPILFLTALDTMDDRIKGYALGADDFITKSQIDYKELGVRIKAAIERAKRLSESGRGTSKGTVIGLLSIRGGVGVSTLAMHLARHATTVSDRPVILIDLAFPVGSISLWSGISGPRNSVTLLSRAPAEIDLSVINNYSLQNVYGSYFIPGPASLMDLSAIRTQALERVLEILRDAGYVVILDLGRATLPLMWDTLTKCDWIGIVTSADNTSRALAKELMTSLPDQGVDPRSLILLFNDCTNKTPSDISIGLPRTPDVFIPYTESFDELTMSSAFSHLWAIVAAEEQEYLDLSRDDRGVSGDL
jgi:DNA-binding response OmpR family regulator